MVEQIEAGAETNACISIALWELPVRRLTFKLRRHSPTLGTFSRELCFRLDVSIRKRRGPRESGRRRPMIDREDT